MVSEATKLNRLELGADWLDSSDAARIIGTTAKQLNATLGAMLTRQSRSMAGRGARCVGWAYASGDCERVVAIKQAMGCNALEATKTLHAIRRLGELGLLEGIESQQNLKLFKPHEKRRRQ